MVERRSSKREKAMNSGNKECKGGGRKWIKLYEASSRYTFNVKREHALSNRNDFFLVCYCNWSHLVAFIMYIIKQPEKFHMLSIAVFWINNHCFHKKRGIHLSVRNSTRSTWITPSFYPDLLLLSARSFHLINFFERSGLFFSLETREILSLN